MRHTLCFVVVCCANTALAARLPVYTEPGQGGERQLILRNFDSLGGAMAGVAHSSGGSAGLPTWAPIVGREASFWLTTYSGPLAFHIEPVPNHNVTGIANFALLFPSSAAWASLRFGDGPLTFSLTSVTETMLDATHGRWTIGVAGETEGVTATGSYTVAFNQPLPEPSCSVTLLMAGVVLLLVRHRR